jgi:polyhydroxyalkanoate synthase
MHWEHVMTTSDSTKPQIEEAAELAAQWKELAEQSQRVLGAFVEKQQKEDGYSIVDSQSLSRAFTSLTRSWLADPQKMMEANMELWKDSIKLWQSSMQRSLGGKGEAVTGPERPDRRFRDPSWEEDIALDYVKQSYFLASRFIRSAVSNVEGLDQKDQEKVNFYTRQFVSALSPSNFAATNPAVMRRVRETGGQCLLSGLKNLLSDMERGKGELKISMTDLDAFRVGENIAVSPGKVIYQNELMQLIQYEPSTEQVYKRPFLIVPPWINKFYILDLQPKNSMIKWIVDQGYTLFVISWTNPRKELAHKSFDDYMRDGPLAALDAIEQATGEKDANILGFCIGGILTEATLAWMAARGDKRVKSATLLATMLDFGETGETSVFIDEEQVASLERHIAEKGYLEGRHMAQMFNMMRENDLIWSFVVNNYLMGRDPMPFDLLYWNSDSTRLPAAMLLYYIQKMYLENGLIKSDYLEINGEKIDVGRVTVPLYSLATKDDHIAPWISCYPVTQRFAGPVRFVLGGSGHIAGIINPPAADKYGYRTNQESPRDPQEWFENAEQHAGSWWTDWHRWLSRKSGSKVPARKPGDGALEPIEDAPGSYVRTSASE